ncbi:hypothetical protein [Streptomyces sp. PU-14G]|uniref:hypothetical protein n=1 Tax=Streptomyces sp. PU-14G TaxID=2800808 RepID=UPI0034DE147D
MYREFTVPDELEIFEKTDAWPEMDESGAYVLTFQYSDTEHLFFSYDVPGRSVRLRWVAENGETIADVFREGATRLSVRHSPGETLIVTDFDMGECNGSLVLRTRPRVKVSDQLLF